MINKKKVRTDIEALRGLSVILVILYHFKLNSLDFQIIKGGFIGVDIFFVISGFIITKIIIDNKLENFSLAYFYERRIKRIIPLLSVVLAFSVFSLFFIFDYFLLNKNINASLAVSTSIANFYFWTSAVLYQFAEENNLINLHFWSLSIEMQFYILFPLLFIFFRKNQRTIHFIIFSLLILSYLFVVQIYKVHNFFNFYNSFSRVFEFLSGAIIFLYNDYFRQKIPKKYYSSLYILGLIILFFYLQFLQDESFHPSPYAMIFIFSIALMLTFNDEKSFKQIKFYFGQLGKISYSLYLWHFPILLLASYTFIELKDYQKIILIIICILISILTYFLVEKKFRESKLIYSISIFIILLVFLIFSKQFANTKKDSYSNYNMDNYYLAHESSLFLRSQSKLSLRKEKNIFSFKNDNLNFSPQFNPQSDKLKILIVGDSHSKDLFNFFKTNEEKFKDYEFARYGINLIDFYNYRREMFLNSNNFKYSDYILFSQRYKSRDLPDLENLINFANENKKKLIIFLKRPEFKSNNRKNQTILDLFYLENNKKVNKEIMDKYLYKKMTPERFIPINDEIKKKYQNDAIIIDLYPVFCDEEKEVCNSVDNNKRKIFYDYGHLTLDGSRYIGNILFENNFHENYFN